MKFSDATQSILECAAVMAVIFVLALFGLQFVDMGPFADWQVASGASLMFLVLLLLSKIDTSEFKEPPQKPLDYYFDLELSLTKESWQESTIKFMDDDD